MQGGAHPEGVGAADVAAPHHVVPLHVIRQGRVAQRLRAKAGRVLMGRRVQVHQQELVLPVRRERRLLAVRVRRDVRVMSGSIWNLRCMEPTHVHLLVIRQG